VWINPLSVPAGQQRRTPSWPPPRRARHTLRGGSDACSLAEELVATPRHAGTYSVSEVN
jgi:hypothetical protein